MWCKPICANERTHYYSRVGKEVLKRLKEAPCALYCMKCASAIYSGGHDKFMCKVCHPIFP